MNKKAIATLALMSPEERALQVMGVEQTKAQLVELAQESTSITTAEGKDNYAATHAARMKLKNTRVAIQKTGKEAREDATAFSKAVIAVEKDLIALISPEEDRLQALQDAQDAIIEAERAAIAAREAERVAAVERAIKGMRDCPLDVQYASSLAIMDKIAWLMEQDDECFEGDYLEQAQSAKRQAMAQLAHMLKQKQAAEAQEEQLRKDREELAARKAELDRIEREAQARRFEEDRVAREAAASRQAEIERQEAELRARQKAQAEAERQEAERLEQERVAQQIKDEEAAIEAAVASAEIKDAIRDAAFYLQASAGPQSKVYRSLVAAARRHFNEEF